MVSNPDLLHLIKRHFVAAAVVKLRRAGAGVVRHDGGFLQAAAVLEIGGDAGRPEAVVSGLGRDPGGGHAALDHRVGVRLGEGGRGELAGAAPNGAEQRPLGIVAKAAPSR